MSKDAKKDLQDFATALLSTVDGIRKAQEARAASERVRRAKLTPEQRADEDRELARRQVEAEKQKLRQQLTAMGDEVLMRETWTIDQFAWLLAGAHPEDVSWSYFDSRSSKEQKAHKTYATILQSCVGPLLRAVNAGESNDKHRFPVQSLIATARLKRIGCYGLLEELIAPRAAPVAPVATPRAPMAQLKNPTLHKVGLDAREQQKTRRQRDLVAFARACVESKTAVAKAGAIVFPIRGTELVEQFKVAHPEWQHVTLETFARDRKAVRPRIEVAPGRPPNKDR